MIVCEMNKCCYFIYDLFVLSSERNFNILSTIFLYLSASDDCGCRTTIGVPASANSDSVGSIAILSSSSISHSLAIWFISRGYNSMVSLHLVHVTWLMFSMIPMSGTFSVLYMSAPLIVTSKAAFCGVLTRRTPDIGTCWANDKCKSPVPGGVSTIRMSNGDQSVPLRSLCMADITNGPRQIIGLFGSIRNPIDILEIGENYVQVCSDCMQDPQHLPFHTVVL